MLEDAQEDSSHRKEWTRRGKNEKSIGKADSRCSWRMAGRGGSGVEKDGKANTISKGSCFKTATNYVKADGAVGTGMMQPRLPIRLVSGFV